MGISDIIPGVSGGTIALILGVYERLIAALGNINLKFIYYYYLYLRGNQTKWKKKSLKEFNRMDPWFLLSLGIGVALALILGSFVIPFLMHSYPVLMFSFFAGLILASVILIYLRRIKTLEANAIPYGLFGFIAGFLIAGMSELQTNHGILVLFFSGVLAICAMLLPGVSGSFMLLLIGQYSYALSLLHHPFANIWRITTLILGGLTGLLVMSKVISYLLSKHHMKMLLFLIGLMLGSMRLIYNNIISTSPNILTSIYGLLCFIIGGGFVCLLHYNNVD